MFAEQSKVCDASKMQIENRKITHTPAWKASSGIVCALFFFFFWQWKGNVKYLLKDFVNVVDICNEFLTHKLEYSQIGTPANACATS